MKAPSLKSLLLVGLAGCGALAVQAQPTPKIAVVDLAKLFDNYWQTSVESAKINSERAQAQTSADTIIKERADLIQKAQQLYNETNSNPAITPEAKAKAEAQLKDWSAAIKAKNTDLQTFSNNTTDVLRNEFTTYKNLAISTITEVATRIAKAHGNNLLLDRSQSTAYGTSNFLYISPDYSDLTDEVLKDLNRDHPTPPPSATTTPPASTPPTTGPKIPSVTFPSPSSSK